MSDSDDLHELLEAVDLVLEYNTPNRILRLMQLVEKHRPDHYGWGSWLAARGYEHEAKSEA